MDIREQIGAAIADLSPCDSIVVLGIMVDAIMKELEKIKKEIRKTVNIPINEIDISPRHPFYVENDEYMRSLIKSIGKYGMITPGVVRMKKDGRYELISGHRRLWACKMAGLDEFRCEVLHLSDKEAAILMIEANRQRLKMRPGEKCQLYRLRDKVSEPYEDISNLRMETGDDQAKINAYIHLEDLIPDLMELLDEGRMAHRPAFVLASIPKKYQRLIFEKIELDQSYPTYSQAIRMRKLCDEDHLTRERIDEILDELKPNQKERIILSDERTLSLIPKDVSVSSQEEYIAKALEFYEKAGGKDGKKSN